MYYYEYDYYYYSYITHTRGQTYLHNSTLIQIYTQIYYTQIYCTQIYYTQIYAQIYAHTCDHPHPTPTPLGIGESARSRSYPSGLEARQRVAEQSRAGQDHRFRSGALLRGPVALAASDTQPRESLVSSPRNVARDHGLRPPRRYVVHGVHHGVLGARQTCLSRGIRGAISTTGTEKEN